MKIHPTFFALSASLMALASPATAAITITLTESATDGAPNPIPTVTGTNQFIAIGGLFSTVTLPGFFATVPANFSFTYNLMEPPGTSNDLPGLGVPGVSDQITFSNIENALVITFTSDPLNFIQTSYGAANETGDLQTILLPPNMPQGRDTLTVMARSDVEPGVAEPATWGMMLIGFGGIGMAMRHRRRSRALLQIA